ncbi:MAG: hypothetical protein IPF83_12745 [Rhodanobacteraceae bacterium]|nr:hypothetical protein [Rhodanobacteraceae bacterium]
MAKLNLSTLYRDATRGLPQDADARLATAELLTLVRGESLGSRQGAALAGLAASSDQALAARIAMATQDWSQALANDLVALRRPGMRERISAWFKAATLPPVFAACAISLLARRRVAHQRTHACTALRQRHSSPQTTSYSAVISMTPSLKPTLPTNYSTVISIADSEPSRDP